MDLTKKYNRKDFVNFLRNEFLPEDFEIGEEEIPVVKSWRKFREITELGKSDELDLTVLEIKHDSVNDPRVTLTRDSFDMLKKYSSTRNALVAYFCEHDSKWRFSFITFSVRKNEKGKLERDNSNPRRYSFLLGEGCKRHTPETMLFAKGRVTSTEDLQKRFAIEVVSDEFFKEYKVFYEDFVQYITGARFVEVSKNKYQRKEVHEPNKKIFSGFLKKTSGDVQNAEKLVRDYIKKMMGRLVFLQFLQKKGWLGVPENKDWGCGDENYLLNLFNSCNKKHKDEFVESVLAELFFNTLNNANRDNFVASEVLGKGIKIPYLNGGLFERDAFLENEISINFLPELFANQKEKETERKFAGVKKDYPYTKSCGLFDFFARYNFTIDETDPTDTEIGVDPEMLGKIFENLLEDNKDKGAFYTPKEIVQYMCCESLIAYLSTDNENITEQIRNFVSTHDTQNFTDEQKSMLLLKLKSVKICDPAVGSGAFPMGMMNELLSCRTALEDGEVNRAQIKKEIVQTNIYGVDIEKGAVDIARLRFWLAIVVDEDEPLPLPNLDYKIMQGNSLLESYTDGNVTIDLSKITQTLPGELFDDAQTIKQLQKAISGYYSPQDSMAKEEIREHIKEHVKALLQERKIAGDNKIEKLMKMDLHANSEFFLWHTWFSDVFNRPTEQDSGGFDIVIGNPPYVESRNSAFPDGLKNKLQQEICSRYYDDADRKAFSRGADLLLFFYELAFRLINTNGINCFITQNSWLSTDYGKQFQNYLLKNIKVIAIVDSDYKYFETADINTVITFFGKLNEQKKYTIRFFNCHIDLAAHPCNITSPTDTDNDILQNTFLSDDNLLQKYKWSFIYNSDAKFISLIELLNEKNNMEISKHFEIGQGLNITKNKILTKKTKTTLPLFVADNNASYQWNVCNYYVDKKEINAARKYPALILPRGIGTHFCCYNNLNGFSTSYVEIYRKENCTDEDVLKVWTFCNSSILWLLREYSGRTNLGGGMLKAEATDLKSLPLYFDFSNVAEIRKIFSDSKNQKIPTNIEDAINSDIHKRIDDIVFSFFGLNGDRKFVVDLLKEKVKLRSTKSKH